MSLRTPLLRALPRTSSRRTFATIVDSHLPITHLPPPLSARRPPPRRRTAPTAPTPAPSPPPRFTISRSTTTVTLTTGFLLLGTFLLLSPQLHADSDSKTPFPEITTTIPPPSDPNFVDSTTTSVPPFPRTLELNDGVYQYVGLGVRTVSFLNIQVYAMGFYIHSDDLAAVQKRVLGKVVGEAATMATVTEREGMREVLEGEEGSLEVWKEMLLGEGAGGFRSVWRIVPTRNTDFQHLRDGWVRGIQSRTKEFDDGAFAVAMGEFKAMFGGAFKKSVPKKKTIFLKRDAEGALTVQFDPTGRNDGKVGGEGPEKELQTLGTVKDKRVSAGLWMNYLAGKTVASEGARKSVVDGLVGMAERPADVLTQ